MGGAVQLLTVHIVAALGSAPRQGHRLRLEGPTAPRGSGAGALFLVGGYPRPPLFDPRRSDDARQDRRHAGTSPPRRPRVHGPQENALGKAEAEARRIARVASVATTFFVPLTEQQF
jgi:hypothetical protein